MKASQPFWRANFIITPLEGVCPFEEEILDSETSSPGVKERRREAGKNDDDLKSAPIFDLGQRGLADLALRTEYQTIVRLPISDCVVFVIHSYIDPLTSLVNSPGAADMIARATNNMNDKTLKYRGMDEDTKVLVIDYLDKIKLENQA